MTVFEQRRVGGGATHASAGALVPYVEAHEPGPLQDLAVRSLNLYDQFIEELRVESGKTIDYARCGSIEVAFTDAEAAVLQSVARRHAADGVRWAGPSDIFELEPGLPDTIRGGLVAATHGYVSARQLTGRLADAAAAGGAVFRSARVTAIAPDGDASAIVTDAGASERFDRVIIATGAWARLLDVAQPTRIPVRPVKGQLLRVRGLRLKRLLWSHHCYMVPQRNGDVLVGATMEEAGFDERPTAAGVGELVNAALGLLPGIADAEFVEARVGLRPATDDSLPLVGYARGSTSLIYAVGHFRNGIILAPLTARILADLILDGIEDPAFRTLSPARFGL